MNNASAEIIFSVLPGVDGDIGLITLNKPQVLNALNHAMFLELDAYLHQWELDNSIKAVVIQATEGRAFCAGGDVRSVYQRGLAKDVTLSHFFRDEYELDRRIYHYSKPYISLLNGITMGGGAGISINGTHRVATERLVFAMPETGIGFFPDVGASYFLSRLPGKMGLYLGLSGDRISYADCYALGLVNYCVKPEHLVDIVTRLQNTSLRNNPDAVVADVINHYTYAVSDAPLFQHQLEINACFAKSSVLDIITALEHYPSDWCVALAKRLQQKSPTSLAVSFLQLHKGAQLDFDACMAMELRMATHFMQGNDFFEGVRAVIVDKDKAPQWKPATLAAVQKEEIEKYFGCG